METYKRLLACPGALTSSPNLQNSKHEIRKENRAAGNIPIECDPPLGLAGRLAAGLETAAGVLSGCAADLKGVNAIEGAVVAKGVNMTGGTALFAGDMLAWGAAGASGWKMLMGEGGKSPAGTDGGTTGAKGKGGLLKGCEATSHTGADGGEAGPGGAERN